jgi:hypothetical protein
LVSHSVISQNNLLTGYTARYAEQAAMTPDTKQNLPKLHAKPNRRARLFWGVAFAIFAVVIIYLPLDRWILDERGLDYAQRMSGMAKFFICITTFFIMASFLVTSKQGGNPNRRNPGSAGGAGMGRWRGPL